MSLRDFPCRDTTVDLGSRTARVHVRGRGVLAVPSLLATSAQTGGFLAAGEKALAIRAQTPGDVLFSWPFEGGVPADPQAVQWLLRHLLRIAHRRRYLANPRLALAVPSQITDVQLRALSAAATSVGARWLAMVPVPLAAAIGAGLPLDEPRAVMVVDLGAVVTDIAVMSLGSIAAARTVRVGGQDLDEAIARHVREEKGVLLGADVAATLKARFGAGPQRGFASAPFLVHGRDSDNGLPRPVMLSPADVTAAVSGPLDTLMEAIRTTLAACPPDMVCDLARDGVTLTGGGARLAGLTALVQARTGLPARVAGDDPANVVVLGAAELLEHARDFRRRRVPHRDRRQGFMAAPRRL
ncbi:rod shape-determining protein MreB [Thermomonospora echinospora]|uniref:Rod shape-determining protein MreB n=1 Tax=Thermomonospora echinospora TaxID=1992 RepID=A0A1H6E2R5_9ACTN|nr:rod shape-determining protein [Thermomonospora echinospora]SEG91195.1 rod shape-determining protein MreB [Thermomonospora echinospora]